jgi:hypothetical protein
VLNASHQPLAVVAARRAVILVLKDKAEVVVSNGQVFRSEHLHVDAPSVLRLRTFVKIPHRSHAPLTRRAVFARDEWACQYCGASAENLDHVVPRSRGGAHSWDNVGRGVPAVQLAQGEPADRGGRAPPGPPTGPPEGRVPTVDRASRARVGALPLASPGRPSLPPVPRLNG